MAIKRILPPTASAFAQTARLLRLAFPSGSQTLKGGVIPLSPDLFSNFGRPFVLTCLWTIFGSIRSESMRLSSRIKPISYLKAYASEIVRTIRDDRSHSSSPRTEKPRRSCRMSTPTSRRRRPWRCSRYSRLVIVRSKRAGCDPPPITSRGCGSGDRLPDALPGSFDR